MRLLATLIAVLVVAAAVCSAHGGHEGHEYNITCFRGEELEHGVTCDGLLLVPVEGHLQPNQLKFWLFALVALILTLASGCFSGLTIAYASLDIMDLEILKNSGSQREAKLATRIYPLISRRHWMLVTLLLANAACMEALPIVLDRIFPSWLAIVVSVTAVLFFGEIIPQSLCSRYGLEIGAFFGPVIWFLMWLFGIVGYPISLLLDQLLGHEELSTYRRKELKELLRIHAKEAALSSDEAMIIQGTLDLYGKTVGSCMTPLERVFMLPVTAVLDRETISTIVQTGHSRVPIWRDSREDIIGVMMVKSLLLLDTRDCTPISSLTLNDCPNIVSTESLFLLLDMCQTGRSHLVAVRDSITDKVVGIATLEDVIEEILCEEILDETDVYVDNSQSQKVERRHHHTVAPDKARMSAAFALRQRSQALGGSAIAMGSGSVELASTAGVVPAAPNVVAAAAAAAVAAAAAHGDLAPHGVERTTSGSRLSLSAVRRGPSSGSPLAQPSASTAISDKASLLSHTDDN